MKLWRSLLAAVLTVLMVASLCVNTMAYTDVPEGDAYGEYIKIVDSLGLIPANTMGDFNPKGYYTRGEALITAYRMINGGDNGIEDFAESGSGIFDDIDTSHPIAPYIAWAYDNALITNDLSEKNFLPAEPISAAEFLTLFVKVGCIDPAASASEGAGEGGMPPVSDGEGTTSESALVYPDSYVDAAYSFAGDIMGDEETITREMAAMAIAQLLWYQDDETSIELSTLTDDQGNLLDCFATNVYGLNKVTLNIRATKDRTMGYDFNGDVLLSNGSVLNTDEDLSKYIGHPMVVTYRDMDRSSTLTEDEEIISYVVNSLMLLQPTLSEITLKNNHTFVVNSLGLTFNVTNATKFYYNDEVWGEDPLINLIDIAGGTGSTTIIANRPNMSFTVVPSEVFDPVTSENLVLELFVEEHRPAKIVGASDGTYTLLDYYQRGTDKEYVQFSTDSIVFKTANSSVGDYVNYYTSGGKCYILDGSALKTKIAAINPGNILALEDGTLLTPHQLYLRNNTLPEVGKEMVIITEDVTGTYYLGWEYPTAIEKTPAMVISLTENLDSVTYVLYDCASGEEMTIEVTMDNIFASSKIEAGEFIYYSMDTEDAYSIVRANVSEKVHLGVETDEYFVESETGTEYKKSPYYYGNLYTDTFKADYYKMILDISGNVLALF